MTQEQLAIVGGGPGGADLLRTLLNTPGIRIIGLADLNENSPGMTLAREQRVFTTTNFKDFFSMPGHKVVFDATGIPAVNQGLRALADHDNVIVEPTIAKLIWQMVDAREAREATVLRESSMLFSSIESGLDHIESLSSGHSRVLQQAAAEIENLSNYAQQSLALLGETGEVIRILENVASKTRMLGINAAIESTRAGQFGRGFSVVADSIHELAASSVESVKSASVTINDIQKALQTIAKIVEKVVLYIQQIEGNHTVLAQELHTSLEEMTTSVKKLNEVKGGE